MRTRLAVTIALAYFIAITLFLSAREARVLDSANTYSHGEMTCLQGIKGPGLVPQVRARLSGANLGGGPIFEKPESAP